MRQNRRRNTILLEDPELELQQIYDPFSLAKMTSQQLRKQIKKIVVPGNLKCSVKLFQEEQDQHQVQGCYKSQYQQQQSYQSYIQPKVELNVMKQINFNTRRQNNNHEPAKLPLIVDSEKNTEKQKQKQKEFEIVTKIIASKNKKKLPNPNPLPVSAKIEPSQQFYGFNSRYVISYPQTPGFKSLLHSPFSKFNDLFKHKISIMNRENQAHINGHTQPDTKISYEPVQLTANPLDFYIKSKLAFDTSKYFVGIGLKMKQENFHVQCLYFCHLACYAEPFNDKPWRRYVSLLEEQGKLNIAFLIAKTGFLFTQSQQLVKNFLLLGQKCGMPLDKIQGIMSSISNPEIFQKTLLPQSSKLYLKYGQIWKGIKMLYQICNKNNYKLSVCLNTLYLARFLQNIGYGDHAMNILKASFSKSTSKLQIYLLYMEISQRKNGGLVQQHLQDVLKYSDYISGENKYRFFLQIAEILYKNNDQRSSTFISNAFTAAKEYCAAGAGTNKALKQIYYTIAKMKGVRPKMISVASDSSIFQQNRYNFIHGQQLIQFQFEDWKYYLHYGVAKRADLLAQAAKKWPLTGRIVAQWIHCLRLVKKPLQILKIWRDKIDQVPKSGQLWCEGGRIYAEIGQYTNAEKCFRCAIHFTPQYGDSFIQQLRLLLQQSKFLQIYRLKKLFLASQPFYGHVLSYLKLNNWYSYSLSLNQVWQNAVYQICSQLYNKNSNNEIQNQKQKQNQANNNENLLLKNFTAYAPYNRAFIYQSNLCDRKRLFTSYQQMENKN